MARVGIRVYCTVCKDPKLPRGRSEPMLSGPYCRSYDEYDIGKPGCPGYEQDPKVGCLWPGESQRDYGYCTCVVGTKELTFTDDDRLSVNLYDGDFGSVGDRVLKNRIVTTRKPHRCNWCNESHDIAIGSRARVEAGVFDGQFMTSYVCVGGINTYLEEHA